MAHNPGDLPHEDPVGSGKWFWPDGSAVTPEEDAELKRQASGGNPTPGSGIDTGARGTGPFDWLLPKQIDRDAPGASLDPTLSEDSRARTQGLLEQLQQQAATGGGAWEKTLADATARAQQTASALGQTQTGQGGSYQSALRNIGNAQSGAAQRAVGQGNILREQSKAEAQDLLGSVIPGMGGQDIQQATAESAAAQQLREANTALVQKARETAMKVGAATGQSFMSDGGPVPGIPMVMGDDERNDTVPAMLSPGEIVVPRSEAGDPESAAAFARAVAARGGARAMAEGGDLDEKGGYTGTRNLTWDEFWDGTNQRAPSIENGGLLDDASAYAMHSAAMENADLIAQRAAGQGGIGGQLVTNAADQTISGALQSTQASNAANAMASAVAQQQEAGGEAAATSGNEQAKAARSLAATSTAQRANDLALARAQQGAAWRNTALNAGLSLENQALVGRLVSGGAQGIAALGHAGFGADEGGEDPYSLPSSDVEDTGYLEEGAGPAQESEAGDFNPPDEDTQYAAHGGVIEGDERARARRFLSMLRRAA